MHSSGAVVHWCSGAVEDPCCIDSRGASFATPCYYICVTLRSGLLCSNVLGGGGWNTLPWNQATPAGEQIHP
jgi:hypothetical protein